MIAFIGTNGVGKSTTIKMLTGILYPDKGDISVLVFDPKRDRKKISISNRYCVWLKRTIVDSFDIV